MSTDNNPHFKGIKSTQQQSLDLSQAFTPTAARDQLRELATFRFSPVEGDSREIIDTLEWINDRLDYLSETLITPLLEADPHGITAVDYSGKPAFNFLGSGVLETARAGWDEYSYEEITDRPALTHATNASLIAALSRELKKYLELVTAELAIVRTDLRPKVGSLDSSAQDVAESDGPSSSVGVHENEEADYDTDEQCAFDPEDFSSPILEVNLILELDNGLGNVGWIEATPGLGQTFEFIPSNEKKVVDAIKQLAEERAIIDTLRLAGVHSHFFTKLPLAEMIEGVNNAQRYQEILDIACEEADLFSDLKKAPKTQRRHLTDAGCSQLLFRGGVSRDEGNWGEVGNFSPEAVAKVAPIVSRCLGITPAKRLDDDLMRLAFSLPISDWRVRADTNAPGKHIMVWENVDSTMDEWLEVEVTLEGAFNQRVAGVTVIHSKGYMQDGEVRARVEVIEDCFETRALYQLLSYFSERAGKI